MFNKTPEIRQAAVKTLTAQLVQQGHPEQYAAYMATAIIFQADLDLASAQLFSLVSWLKEKDPEIYKEALTILEATAREFEKRVQS
ncbi:MAG: hypothetical protein QNJ68_22690 [Microcoleaceae cyanobacterium MO_207.B10]|nr:hypothetical protein [Microcoleaceae cyanobacterium MO_207.B10]